MNIVTRQMENHPEQQKYDHLPDSHWLNINKNTLFQLNAAGHIEFENDPNQSPGPLVWIGTCNEGTVVCFHSSLTDGVMAETQRIVAAENVFTSSERLNRLLNYISGTDTSRTISSNFGVVYELPLRIPYTSTVHIVNYDSEEGKQLIQAWDTDGLPPSLIELGFRTIPDIWPPWCAVLLPKNNDSNDNTVASIAFTARLSETGAELGLATVKQYRNRGFAKLATAAWTRIAELQNRKLFYSADQANQASRNVASKSLKLIELGNTLRIFS